MKGVLKIMDSQIRHVQSLHGIEATAEFEGLYDVLFEQCLDGVIILVDGLLVKANRAFCDLFGRSVESMIGKDPVDFLHPDDRMTATRRITTLMNGKVFTVTREYRGIRGDGSQFWAELRSTLIKMGEKPAIQCIVRNIDEQKTARASLRKSEVQHRLMITRQKEANRALAAQLSQAQKMEAIGTLAGGIAHDFNNILAGILACTELSLLKIAPDHPARHHLEQILKAGERAGNLVRQILEFSRKGEQQRIAVQVDEVTKEVINLLRASLPANIEIQQATKNFAGAVMGDPTQIHQILINLCTNAAHAMQVKGGILTVALDEIHFDEEDARACGEIAPGPYVRLTVGDTGHGMNPRTVERIFEPYFTTKEKGEGTGMGLAVVHGIVKGLGGIIDVKSEVHKGTRFEVLIPMINNGYEAENRPPNNIPGGHERILFVDDENILIETMKAILMALGYDVDTMKSGVEALELIRMKPETYDLIITDQSMPKMTGVQFARALKKLGLQIPMILCTGFSEVISREEARSIGIRDFIMKPILMENLAEIIRNVLDEGELKTVRD